MFARAGTFVVCSMLVMSAPAARGVSCNVVVDPARDEAPGGIAGHVDHAALDVVSADVATDATRLTAAIRLRNVARTRVPLVQESSYRLRFTVDGVTFAFWVTRSDLGDFFDFTREEQRTDVSTTYHGIASVRGVVDTARNEIRMTAPLALLAPARVVPGTPITGIDVRTADQVRPLFAPGSFAWDYTAPGRYRAGAPSCLAVGS